MIPGVSGTRFEVGSEATRASVPVPIPPAHLARPFTSPRISRGQTESVADGGGRLPRACAGIGGAKMGRSSIRVLPTEGSRRP